MPDKFDQLRSLLFGPRAGYKVPSERPGQRSQRRAFDSFSRAASSLYNQAIAGGMERRERMKDYDEMDMTPEIAQALNIYADDSCTYSEEGIVLDIVSEDERIVRELEELYYERLDIEFHLWQWIRNMCKYGDHFNLLDIVDGEGVLGSISLPVGEIEREEGYDGDPNSLRFRWTAQGNTVFDTYQISHMRILGDDRFLPYGRSVLDSGRKIWKQLQLAEDAMLIYRIVRAPERRVFKIDVANIPPNEVEQYILQVRDKLKRTPLITQSDGQIDLRFNPMSIDEDFFLPMRGDRGSNIETLPGGSNQGDIEDIEYIQNKLFIALGVPKSYLTAEEDMGGKGTLAQEDIKFARSIQRIQKITVSELAKIGIIHLFLRGFDPDTIYNFDLKLTNPSTVMEMMQLDLIEKRYGLADNAKQTGLVDETTIKKDILRMTDREIARSVKGTYDDAQRRYIISQLEAEGAQPPASDAGFGDAQPPGDEPPEEEEESDENEDSFVGMGGNPMRVPDPTGARYIPGASIIDIANDRSLLQPKRRRGRRDPFSSTVREQKATDPFKYNKNISSMLERLNHKINTGKGDTNKV